MTLMEIEPFAPIKESLVQLPPIDVPTTDAEEAANTRGGTIKTDVNILEADLRFFEAWEKGEVHFLSAILRVRQMHRAIRSLRVGCPPGPVLPDECPFV